MRILVQKSLKSSVSVDNKVVGKIDYGLVLFVGFTYGDNSEIIDYMVNKVINLRIFEDKNDVMNLSVLDVGGQILSISQFTLYGDAKKGNRPSYVHALKSDEASKLYSEFNNKLMKHINVSTGVFGASMEVNIVNSGPTTILLERGLYDKK